MLNKNMETILKDCDIEYCSKRDDFDFKRLVEEYPHLIGKVKESFVKIQNYSSLVELVEYYDFPRKWLEDIIEKEGLSEFAYKMVMDCGSKVDWAEKIIEKSKDSYRAYLLLRNINEIDVDQFDKNNYKGYNYYKKWAKKIVKENKDFNSARLMVLYCDVDRDWAEDFVEEVGDPFSAYLMCRFCRSDKEWAEKIIEKCNDAYTAYVAYLMVRYCNSSREWAEKIIERCKNKDLIEGIAYEMFRYCGSSKAWYEEVTGRKNKGCLNENDS